MQPLLFFFVDAASSIDQEDEGWHLLTAVEQTPQGVEVGCFLCLLLACSAFHAIANSQHHWVGACHNSLLRQTLPSFPNLLASRRLQVLGFSTVYRHYHYPAGARLKLAQILVLPPYQGRGVGSMLVQAAQQLAQEMGACDLSVSFSWMME